MATKSITSATSKTSKTSSAKVFVRNPVTKINPIDDYTAKVDRWDIGTLQHCLDMIEDNRLTMPFKIKIIHAKAEAEGLGSFETA